MTIRILMLALLVVLLAACTPLGAALPTPTRVGEIAIPFTTIDVTIDNWGQPTPTFITPPEVERPQGSWPMPDLPIEQWPSGPHLYLLSAPNDIDEVAQYLQPETVAAIAASDFTTDIVLVLLRGVSGSSGFDTLIERIGYQNNTLTVYAQFWKPSNGWLESASFPFHVVRVKRSDLPVNLDAVSLKVQLESHEVTPTPYPPKGLPPGYP